MGFFSEKILEGISPFCSAVDIPDLNIELVMSALDFKARVDPLDCDGFFRFTERKFLLIY